MPFNHILKIVNIQYFVHAQILHDSCKCDKNKILIAQQTDIIHKKVM